MQRPAPASGIRALGHLPSWTYTRIVLSVGRLVAHHMLQRTVWAEHAPPPDSPSACLCRRGSRAALSTSEAESSRQSRYRYPRGCMSVAEAKAKPCRSRSASEHSDCPQKQSSFTRRACHPRHRRHEWSQKMFHRDLLPQRVHQMHWHLPEANHPNTSCRSACRHLRVYRQLGVSPDTKCEHHPPPPRTRSEATHCAPIPSEIQEKVPTAQNQAGYADASVQTLMADHPTIHSPMNARHPIQTTSVLAYICLGHPYLPMATCPGRQRTSWEKTAHTTMS